MTKRSLLFIILMTLTFFAANYFITSKSLKKERATYNQEVQTKQQDLQNRVLPVSLLPVVQLRNTENNSLIESLHFDSVYIARSSAERLSLNGRELSFLFESPHIPYGVYHYETPRLSSVYLPPKGVTDLQVITIEPETSRIVTTIGQYENRRLYFPLEKPKDFAIVAYEKGNTLLPVGFYDPQNDRFYHLSDLPKFQNITTFQQIQPEEIPLQGEEKYFVLENAYQQLVFSNVGGSLVEINLPFQNSENTQSVVRPIKFDREIKNQSEANAYFPLHSYEMAIDGKATAKKPSFGGYLPLIRRSLLGSSGHPYHSTPSRYYALNILSDDQSSSPTYQLRRLEKNTIEFERSEGNRRIIKTFSLPENPDSAPYTFDLSIRVEGNARGLWLTTGVPEVELISGSYSPTLKYRMLRGQKSVVEKIKLPKSFSSYSSVMPDWVCNSNGFFGIILDPLQEVGSGFQADFVPGNADPTRLTLIDPQHNVYPADKYPGYLMQLPLRESSQPMNFRVYAGPFATKLLKVVDATYANPRTGYNPDYIGAQSFHGWFAFISEPFAKFLFLLMQVFYQFTHSWGFSIILLTIALRIMLYPLNTWSIKSNLRMQQVQPKVAAIQEKFKKDPKRMQMEIMQLYKKEKANPFTGCLPILIQMPFLVGMFDLLKSNFDLRGASFIPGWINNLTAPDALFSWGYPIPFIGTEFHLLPVLLGVVMYFQQKVSMKKQAGKTPEQAKQQKMMGNIFTIVFTVLFYNLPSGLNIYFLSSMALQLLQQWHMARKMKQNKASSISPS